MKQHTISIQVDDDLLSFIKQISKEEGLSISAIIRRLIIKHKKEIEKHEQN